MRLGDADIEGRARVPWFIFLRNLEADALLEMKTCESVFWFDSLMSSRVQSRFSTLPHSLVLVGHAANQQENCLR